MPDDFEYFHRWNERLECFVRTLSYDFYLKKGVLCLGHGSVAHRNGVIELFVGIDMEVQWIEVQSDRGDRQYIRPQGEGDWQTHKFSTRTAGDAER